MRRDHQQKTKFFDVNYLIGTIQCLALATIDLHPKGAFSFPLYPYYSRGHIFQSSLNFCAPSSFWICLKSTQHPNNCVAKLCLNEWTETLFAIPVFSQACSKLAWTVIVDMCFAGFIPINNQFPCLYFSWYSLNVTIATSENTVLSFSDCISSA